MPHLSPFNWLILFQLMLMVMVYVSTNMWWTQNNMFKPVKQHSLNTKKMKWLWY